MGPLVDSLFPGGDDDDDDDGGDDDGNGRLALEDVEVRRIWKKYSEAPYNLNTPEQVTVHMCGFHGVRRCNYFGGMPIRRNEV